MAMLIVPMAVWLQARSPARPLLGVFTTLPIVWNEASSPAEMLDAHQPKPWPRTALEAEFRLLPLNTLLKLERLQDLLIAQPRPFAPQENVALDAWVRGGGHLLLFADPMLTAHSRFALGDPRRPQDIALLSPILAHWGLELRYDEAQPLGMRDIAGSALALNLPVNLSGHWAAHRGAAANCQIEQAGLVASCEIGAGRALLVADAALFDLDPEPDYAAARQAQALRALSIRAFAR